MKKIALVAIIALLAIGFTSAAFAEKGRGDKKCEDKMEKCHMHKMMMMNMAEKKMVATSDGGVVLMCCGKLTKYDSNLNLVKEIELNMDTEAMQKKMTDAQQNCPMCSKMQGKK